MEEPNIVQEMTYQERKEQIRNRLNDVAGDFVAIGYHLKHIQSNNSFTEDGYNDIYEFASKEYGISKSTASRFMAINTKFSVSGNSLQLISSYAAYGSSKLQEMLQLSDQDCELITKETSREEIREFKEYRKEEAVSESQPKPPVAHAQQTEPTNTEDNFDENPQNKGKTEDINHPNTQSVPVNTNTEEANNLTDIEKILIAFFGESGKHKKRHQQMLVLQTMYNGTKEPDAAALERIAEIINPNGHDTFKKVPYFVFFYGIFEGIAYSKFGSSENKKLSYLAFWQSTVDFFNFGTYEDAWLNYYGAEEEIEPEKPPVAHAQQQKPTSTKPDSGKVETTKTEPKKLKESLPEKTEKSTTEPPETTEQLPGQIKIEDYPELLPDKADSKADNKEEYDFSKSASTLAKEHETNGGCPTKVGSCRRQEWGTSEAEQETGRKECAKCWEEFFKTERVLRNAQQQESTNTDINSDSPDPAAGQIEKLTGEVEETPKQTIYDYILTLSIENMARKARDLSMCPPKQACNKEDGCKECWMKWLSSEHKED